MPSNLTARQSICKDMGELYANYRAGKYKPFTGIVNIGYTEERAVLPQVISFSPQNKFLPGQEFQIGMLRSHINVFCLWDRKQNSTVSIHSKYSTLGINGVLECGAENVPAEKGFKGILEDDKHPLDCENMKEFVSNFKQACEWQMSFCASRGRVVNKVDEVIGQLGPCAPLGLTQAGKLLSELEKTEFDLDKLCNALNSANETLTTMISKHKFVKEKYPETANILSKFSRDCRLSCSSSVFFKAYSYELNIVNGQITFATIDSETGERTAGERRRCREFYGLRELEEGIGLAKALNDAFSMIKQDHTREQEHTVRAHKN